MAEKPANPLAFPVATIDGYTQDGMTLRDYFAAAALQGLLSNAQIAKDAVKNKMWPEDNQAWHASTAYAFAGAMLAEREKDNG